MKGKADGNFMLTSFCVVHHSSEQRHSHSTGRVCLPTILDRVVQHENEDVQCIYML